MKNENFSKKHLIKSELLEFLNEILDEKEVEKFFEIVNNENFELINEVLAYAKKRRKNESKL